MTTLSPPPQEVKSSFDPDDFRMTIGEHLEELRKRLIYGLVGFVLALVVCMAFGEKVITIFCRPLIRGLATEHITPQMYFIGLTDVFMTYLQISIISAVVLAGPWMLYQLWLFVAAGLYPKERKTITRYIPLSITLLLAGVLFVYFLVLPLTIAFFLKFSSSIPLPESVFTPSPSIEVKSDFFRVPVLAGDPAKPQPGFVWVNSLEERLKIYVNGHTRVINFGPDNLLAPHLSLSEYISFVITFMLVFGLAFQLPLVLLALVRVGIVEIDFLRKQRRLVYFIMAIVAAVIAPGDVVTSMLALLIPLLLLYEFGIWLAQWGQNKREKEAEAALRE